MSSVVATPRFTLKTLEAFELRIVLLVIRLALCWLSAVVLSVGSAQRPLSERSLVKPRRERAKGARVFSVL